MTRFEEAYATMQRGISIEPENNVSSHFSVISTRIIPTKSILNNGQDYRKYAEELDGKVQASKPRTIEASEEKASVDVVSEKS
jgi:hypothetical protein